ncbi:MULTISPECIES: LysR family transcriptional regulator [Acinetobacter]|uniref:LysR family transcriptional regulator n=1 Tax=Acinetobacter TaxID=469 RepID=UPI001CD53E8F|nr:LysR family transcriptional regulator [Acinetobacter guillouiae]
MINFRLMRHLWLFLVVAEEQHFGRAAKRLGMTQPPLTEQIQILENALKVKLFIRSKRGAQLTPIGQAIYPAVKKFSDQMEQLEFAVSEAIHGQNGTLTIGGISTAMFEVLPNLLDQLRHEHPDLTILVKEIDSADAAPLLESGEIDLAFARLQGEVGTNLKSIKLIEDSLVVVVPKSHHLASNQQIELKQLSEEIFIMFSRKFSPIYFDTIVSACNTSGFSPRILHEVHSVSTQVAFVSCGQGIALVPASLRKIAPENVVCIPLKETIEVVTTAIAWNTRNTNPAIVFALDQVAKNFNMV